MKSMKKNLKKKKIIKTKNKMNMVMKIFLKKKRNLTIITIKIKRKKNKVKKSQIMMNRDSMMMRLKRKRKKIQRMKSLWKRINKSKRMSMITTLMMKRLIDLILNKQKIKEIFIFCNNLIQKYFYFAYQCLF